MSPTIGSILMAIAAVAAVGSIGALAWGTRKGDEGEGAVNAGYLATFAVLGALTLAYGVLLVAFLSEDFSFMYVAENHSTDVSNLAWLYKISGTWAGREGSLLLWAWILSMFAAWVAYRRITVTDRLSNVGLAVTNFIQLFFLVTLFVETNNPF